MTKASGKTSVAIVDQNGKAASAPNGVSVTCNETSGAVTITVTNYAYFYVFHSNAGKGTVSLQKVRIDGTNNESATDEDRGHWNSDGKTYNLVACVTEGFLYGGYYSAYNGADAQVETDHVVGSSVAYTGQANAWNGGNACTEEKGTAITPEAGRTYFLKEVPNGYFRAATFIVYDTRADNQIKKLYLMTAADDTNYKDIYFKIENPTGITAEKVNHEIFDTEIDIIGGGKSVDPDTNPLTAVDAFRVFDLPGGYLASSDNLTSFIGENNIYTEVPYFVTLDGVTVTGVQKLRVYLRNTKFTPPDGNADHWARPGITKVALHNTYSAQ